VPGGHRQLEPRGTLLESLGRKSVPKTYFNVRAVHHRAISFPNLFRHPLS
jgi:hypothetical protein